MATLTVKNAQGADAGTLEVSDKVFGIKPNVHAVRQAFIAYAANQRQGTHSTRTRGMVSGGGRKPFRQKGTGRARQGSSRAPQYRGGAIIFGPQPRDYRQKVNRKVRRLALYSQLSDLRNQNKLFIVDGMKFDKPRTKDFVALMAALGISDSRRVLVITSCIDEGLLLSARNLPQVEVVQAENVSINELLRCDHLVATGEAIKKLEDLIA